MSGEGRVVCVTGGSGYIASWLVKLLLQRGYTVKATVLDPNDPKQTEHLLALDGAKERLQLFKANLVEEGTFDSAVDGCEGVFHTASPVILSTDDPQNVLLEPAVKGTLNVLKSCSKVPFIKRVVVTSSIATVLFNGKPLTPDVVVDETWFSDPAFCKENKIWYAVSKTLAEDVAWKFAKENGIDLVTLHPGWVIGPFLQPTINLTLEVILNNINGAQIFPNENLRLVDVRDVANAHIQAFERPSASGRYCLVARVTHFSEVWRLCMNTTPLWDFQKASPVILSTNDPEKDLLELAVKGTLNVLRSCAKVPSIKRVVITSSMAAGAVNGKPLSPDVVVDETWFSDVAFLFDPNSSPPPISNLIPTFLCAGAQIFPNENLRLVDVRDVANAHIQAFERPSASGRYCLVARVTHFSEVLRIVHEHDPTLLLPER
ncbi:hypothetical protein GH714_017647 [Hevea brasiliensis]|uniref:NAD-dependent epimerase/dehydratase domain-containing protein n=1 Tax=Hevea brasiliensis TaxID=3981 RepID=A0A6A6N0K2_HEVBR|nr:hypothetical protein GH714_017647 [Hevea brasiliensis]